MRYNAGRQALVSLRFAAALQYPAVLWSYPKSGSTWLRFMLYALENGNAASSFDQVDSAMRDVESLIPTRCRQFRPIQSRVSSLGVKSHDPPPRFFSERRKTVFMVRHPQAMLLSLRRHLQRNHGLEVSDQALLNEIHTNRLVNYEGWATQVDRFFEIDAAKRHLVRYEDLKAKPLLELRALCSFLGIDADEDALRAAIVHSTRPQMKLAESASKRSSLSGFVGGSSMSVANVPFSAEVERLATPQLQRLGYA